MNRSRLVSFLALVVSFAALFVAFGDRPQAPAATGAEGDSQIAADRLSKIEQRLAELAADIESIGRDQAARPALETAGGPPARQTMPQAAGYQAGLRALNGRIDRLEKAFRRMALMGAGQAVTRRIEDRFKSLVDEATRRKRIQEQQQHAKNPSATEQERLRALRELRRMGKGAREVVLSEMILLGQTSPSAATRADVWRQLSGVTDPRLLPPLLTALAHDPDDKTREEAAETLGDFRNRPEARQALEHAARNDASEDVREQARHALGNRRR